MHEIGIREMVPADATVVIALNRSVVEVTSPMEEDQFGSLFTLCDLKLVAIREEQVIAFLIGLSSGLAYENDNYAWFSKRLADFFYIDRVVVSKACAGLGVGKQLYEKTRMWAKASRLSTLCAEITLEPPNHQSLRFHHRVGFVQLGKRRLANGKQLSMQTTCVDP